MFLIVITFKFDFFDLKFEEIKPEIDVLNSERMNSEKKKLTKFRSNVEPRNICTTNNNQVYYNSSFKSLCLNLNLGHWL